MVSPVTITNTFNGDISAANYVNAAALDTQLTNLATTINSEIAERQRTVRDGSGLASQVVRFPSLHPEVTAAITAGGLIPKQAAAVVSTANVGSLSGLLTIDGYTLLANDRVLLVAQASAINNGLWVAAAGVWTRPSDSANAAVLPIYSFVTVIYGTSQAGSAWYLSAASTVNLTAQNWLIYSSGGILPIVRGGTGASDATTARTNLGAPAGIWPITVGGTGASDAATARANLGLGSLAVLSSVTQAQLASDVQYRVDTIAALRALTITYNSVLVLGYYTAGDGGDGLFRWNSSDSTADNLGTIIIPNSAPGTGRWNRVVPSGYKAVKWFGAKGDGTTDDTTSIQAAINYLSGGGVLFFPAGTYKTTATLTVTGNVAQLVGEGNSITKIKFEKTGGGVAVLFQNGAGSIYSCSISGLSFLSSDTTNNKTMVHFVDARTAYCERIESTDGAWTGASSIGVRVAGREAVTIRNCTIYADIPIKVSVDPNYATFSCDLLRIENNILVVSAGLSNASVLIDSDCIFTNMFLSNCAFVRGGYGVYHSRNTGGTVSRGLFISNCRMEQAIAGATYNLYIEAVSGSVQIITVDNFMCSSGINGVYLRTLNSVTLSQVFYTDSSGLYAFNANYTVSGLTLLNCFYETGALLFPSMGDCPGLAMIGCVNGGTPIANARITPRSRSITVNTSLDLSDSTVLIDTTAGVVTATLPTAVNRKGARYTAVRITATANNAQLASTAGQTFNGAASPYVLTAQYKRLTVESDGANWLLVEAN